MFDDRYKLITSIRNEYHFLGFLPVRRGGESEREWHLRRLVELLQRARLPPFLSFGALPWLYPRRPTVSRRRVLPRREISNRIRQAQSRFWLARAPSSALGWFGFSCPQTHNNTPDECFL